MTLRSLIRKTLYASTALLLLAGAASAQTVTSRDDSRGETELRAEVRDAVDRDTDVANTALVFNNTSPNETTVICTAYGANGQFLGRKMARVPARGVRYLRASDLSGGVDFVGSALCASRARVAASAVFLAPGSISNLDVIQAGPWDSHNIRFPLIATY
jgi:hypothetical protein